MLLYEKIHSIIELFSLINYNCHITSGGVIMSNEELRSTITKMLTQCSNKILWLIHDFIVMILDS